VSESSGINGRLGDEELLLVASLDGELRMRGAPKSFFEAMLNARLSAFAAAREATLDGEEDSGGGDVIGAGGNVILFVFAEGEIGKSTL